METSYSEAASKSWSQKDPIAQVRLRAAISLERIARHHERLLRNAINQSPVQTMEDFKLLALLRRNKAGLNQAEASDILLVTKGATSIRVERLFQAGWVDRLPGPDRRTTTIQITPTGETACQQSQKHVSEAHDKLLDHLSLRQLETLAEITDTIDLTQLDRTAKATFEANLTV